MSRPIELVEYEQMLLSRHAMSSHRKESVIGRSAYLLLSRVEAQGAMSIAEFSDAFGLDVSTLQRQTTAALRAGVLRRIPDPQGGIARKFEMTEAGVKALHTERLRIVTALEGALADWSESEIASFAAALKRFNQAIERAGAVAWPR